MNEHLTVNPNGIVFARTNAPVELNEQGFVARLPPREPEMVREEVMTVTFLGTSGKGGFKGRIDFRMRQEASSTAPG